MTLVKATNFFPFHHYHLVQPTSSFTWSTTQPTNCPPCFYSCWTLTLSQLHKHNFLKMQIRSRIHHARNPAMLLIALKIKTTILNTAWKDFYNIVHFYLHGYLKSLSPFSIFQLLWGFSALDHYILSSATGSLHMAVLSPC